LKTQAAIESNRLLPTDPAQRAIAEQLYALVKDYPIISPHGHVDPKILVENRPFRNPAELFIYFDHYVTRLLHADGVELGLVREPADPADEQHARRAWRLFAERWHLLAGTASGYWLALSLESIFGITQEPTAENADQLYDLIQAKLETPELLPRELFESFRIAALATTDDPADDLRDHEALRRDSEFAGRVIPTFRPDFYIEPRSENWLGRVSALCELTGQDLSHQGLVEALWLRRKHFIEHGAVSIDVGAVSAYTTKLDARRAQEIFERASRGIATEQELDDYRGNMIWELARQSCEDGLVITLHVGVFRNHSSETLASFGRDTGHDIPIRAEFTNNLRPLLESFGLNPNLHLILFSLDETTWAREVAPLAGFYPSVFIGAPWWFYDAPHAASRFREATVETAGFYRGSGFIDDTRAFLSIPARHDMARRVDASYLAGLVVSGRLTLTMARKIAVDLVSTVPMRAFKL
jgi:glucuronate isomerase